MLRIICGALFLFSAFSKLFPIEFFEYQLVGDHLSNWSTAVYLSRLIIGFEFFLGFALVLNIDYHRIIVSSTFLLTCLFTIYLLVVLITRGNEPNCNCFGEFVKISVTSSLLKNAILLLTLGCIWKLNNGYLYRFPRTIISSLLIIALVSIYLINPINKTFSNTADSAFVNFKIDLGFLYTEKKYNKPPVNLMQGKHIIAFLSLTCPHCRLAALKFGVITKKKPKLPVYFVLNGDSSNLKDFYDETKSQNIPCNIVKGDSFVTLSGLSLPAIYFVNNGLVEQRQTYVSLDEEMITKWLAKKN